MTATLVDIQNKVRRITKDPSETTLTTAQLNQFLNTVYIYDFPEHLRLKDMLTNYTFSTQPNQEQYALPIDPTSIITNGNPPAPSYTSIEGPIYVGGYQCYFTQSQENFYRLYPAIAINDQPASSDGSPGAFPLQLSNYPIMQNRLVISVQDNSGNNLIATDSPAPFSQYSEANIGNLVGDTTYNALDPTTNFNSLQNYVNYVTGEVSINFSNSTLAGAPINCQLVPYLASRPAAMLFFQNNIILRPIPDSSYQVSVQAYQTFTQFIESNPTGTPYINQWWQYLALLTAMKIFEDRGDFEQIAQYKPLVDEQRYLSQRRTIVEQANERAATIYSEQAQVTFGNFYGVL